MKNTSYIKDFNTYLNESIKNVDWLKVPFDKFLRELDFYIRKESKNKLSITYEFDGECAVVLYKTYKHHSDLYNFDRINASFLDAVIEKKEFKVEIIPTDTKTLKSDIFNITYKAQGDKYIPSFNHEKLFATSYRFKKSEFDDLYGESVWYLTGGIAPPKKIKGEYEKILSIIENAPILDLSDHRHRITARKYGL